MLIKDSKVIQEHNEKQVTNRTREITQLAMDAKIASEDHMTGMDAGMDMTNPEARWGRRMHVSDVVAMLKTMNPKLVFEVSQHLSTLMGIYIPEWELDPATLGWSYNKRYIMCMENGVMPEFTIVYADQIELPNDDGTTKRIKQYTAMKRGWRAVLVTLLWEKLITEAQIAQYFRVGRGEGQESRIWQEETGQGTPSQIEVKEIESGNRNEPKREHWTDTYNIGGYEFTDDRTAEIAIVTANATSDIATDI